MLFGVTKELFCIKLETHKGTWLPFTHTTVFIHGWSKLQRNKIKSDRLHSGRSSIPLWQKLQHQNLCKSHPVDHQSDEGLLQRRSNWSHSPAFLAFTCTCACVWSAALTPVSSVVLQGECSPTRTTPPACWGCGAELWSSSRWRSCATRPTLCKNWVACKRSFALVETCGLTKFQHVFCWFHSCCCGSCWCVFQAGQLKRVYLPTHDIFNFFLCPSKF